MYSAVYSIHGKEQNKVMNKKRYDTIVFDLDGTLLNTLKDLTNCVNYALDQEGFPKREEWEIRSFLGNGIRRLMELSVPENLPKEEFETVFQTFREYYTEHCRIYTRPYDGVMELLQGLKENGYRMAIVSNKLDEAVQELNRDFFTDYVAAAIGQKDGMAKKPAPDGVLAALKQLGGSKRALYVGDSEVDFETAVNSGLDCVLVSWGFRDREQLEKYQAVALIDQPEQLLSWLQTS